MTRAQRERRDAVRAVRPRLAVSWIAVLIVVTLVLRHPAALLGLLVGLLWLGRDLGAGDVVRRTLRVAVPFAAVLFVVQVLIDRNGLTVLARFGDAGPLGQLDITLEAVVGAETQALRVVAGITVTALSLALVDVDRVLASIRHRAPRFGVTATLALRLAPAIAADGRRYADGLRCRADGELGLRDRALVVGAILSRTLDRAADAAAILELRGLGNPARRAVPRRMSWSRAERGVAIGAAVSLAVMVAVEVAGADRFETLPALHGAPAWTAALAGLAVAAGAALPVSLAVRRVRRRLPGLSASTA